MGLVLNMPAPKSAITINTSHPRATMPRIAGKLCHTATDKDSTLPPQQKKASDIIHP
jgi:hypothetical protein